MRRRVVVVLVFLIHWRTTWIMQPTRFGSIGSGIGGDVSSVDG